MKLSMPNSSAILLGLMALAIVPLSGCALTTKPYNLTTTDTKPLPDSRTELVDELAVMFEADQALRRQVKVGQDADDEASLKLMEQLTKVDTSNTERMKHIVMDIGWPTISEYGVQAAGHAWLLVQHADLQPAFQEHCLELMRSLVEEEEVRPQDFAYLTDRVLVAKGKKQIYGTQFHTVKGQLKPRPIRNKKHVDSRREAIGLGTMAEYVKMMRL